MNKTNAFLPLLAWNLACPVAVSEIPLSTKIFKYTITIVVWWYDCFWKLWLYINININNNVFDARIFCKNGRSRRFKSHPVRYWSSGSVGCLGCNGDRGKITNILTKIINIICQIESIRYLLTWIYQYSFSMTTKYSNVLHCKKPCRNRFSS